jgi:hypothetical protein
VNYLQTKVRIVGERELAKKVADCIATNFEVKRRERFNRTPYRYAEAYATGVSYYITVKKEKENVTVKAKSIPELVDKLQKILGQYKSMQSVQPQEVDFPENIKKIYPDYDDHPHSAAMLAVLHANHKGKAHAVVSLDLAKEMMSAFPSLFLGKTEGQVSFGNIFAGTYLQKRGLINIEIREEEDWEYRVYWVD